MYGIILIIASFQYVGILWTYLILHVKCSRLQIKLIPNFSNSLVEENNDNYYYLTYVYYTTTKLYYYYFYVFLLNQTLLLLFSLNSSAWFFPLFLCGPSQAKSLRSHTTRHKTFAIDIKKQT